MGLWVVACGVGGSGVSVCIGYLCERVYWVSMLVLARFVVIVAVVVGGSGVRVCLWTCVCGS